MVIALVLLRVPESFGPRTPLDIGGLLLVSAASLGLVWGLVRGNRAGWGSFEVVATLFTGVVLLVAFVAWERRVHAPMVPMHFFRSRAFSSGNVANFSLFASMGGALFFMAQFLQTAQGYGPLAAGLRLLPWTATLFVVAPIAGALVNRLGERVLIVVGSLAEAAGMIWIALIASPGLPYPELVIPLMLCGCGASLTIPATQSAVINAVATSEIGKASGAFSMLRQISTVFGVSILAAVFAGFGGFNSPLAFSNGFASAIGMAAALGLVGAIAGLMLPGRGRMAVARTTVQASEIREHEPYSEPAQSSGL
jgi:MFS family permease